MQNLIYFQQNGRVSPRTPSDKQSESPVLPTAVTTNGQRSSNNTIPHHGRVSPQTANMDSHNAKTARMEAMAPQGFSSGIPAKIEEGIEPCDNAGEAN